MRIRVRPWLSILGSTALVAALLVPGSAAASTPDSGTLTPSSGPVTWTGGPFAVPNVTGTAGTVDCSVPQSCDDFALTVSTPAGTGDTQELKISTSWDLTAADFDVYVLDANGKQVGESASSADPEVVVLPPTSGTYTVRVVPFTPLGQSYSATAALVDKPNDTPPTSAAPAPTFANYSAPDSLAGSHDSGEPSIGYDTLTGNTMYQSGLATYKVGFDDSTSPATAHWSDVTAGAANGCPQGNTTSLDPILYTDRELGRTFESQLSGVDSLTCYTDDDGATWHPSQGGGIPSGVDHQTLGGGPFVASDPLNATNTYKNAVYYCSQDVATAFCALSRNGGMTFGPGIPTYSLLDCGGLHGHVAVAPDGTVYLPNKSCDGKQAAVVSKDDGQTWTISTVPNSLPGDSDPAVAVGANGSVYFAYGSGDGTPHVAVSHDQGGSWGDDYNVGAALGIKNVVFPTIVAGDDDRAAMSFLGTTTGGDYQATDFPGVWHAYTAFTYDGGKSWVTVDDTPTDPVQRGPICTAGTTCGNDRNLLDFIGSTIDSQGRVEVAYADGCTAGCVSGGTNTYDALATIARQSSGLTLYSAFDPQPNLTVTNVSANKVRAHTYRLSAVVRNVGDAAVQQARVQLLVDGKAVGTSRAHALSSGQKFTFALRWRAKKGRHTVTAVADPTNIVSESAEGDNRGSTTFRVR